MNPEIAAAVRERWHWHLFVAQWIAIGKVAMQSKIVSNLMTINRLLEAGSGWSGYCAQWRAIWFVATQAIIIANQKVQIANLEKLAAPIDDQLDEIGRQVDHLDKVSDAVRIADARYIAALEQALDESTPGWRSRVSKAVPSA